MSNQTESQEQFDDIKSFCIEQLKMLVIKSLGHTEKVCAELISADGDADENAIADEAQQFVSSNRKDLLKSIIDSFSQTLTGEKIVEDGSSKNELSLSLVDDDMLDEMIIIGELTGRIQDYYDLHLKTIKRGLVRLSKEMDFEPEPETLTPKKIIVLLREPLATSELELAGKRIIYKAFTDAAQAELKPLYEGVLALLQDNKTITEKENPASQNYQMIIQSRQQQAAGGTPVSAPPAGADATAIPAGVAAQQAAAAPPIGGGIPMPSGPALAPANLAPVAAGPTIDPSLFQGSATSEAVYGFLNAPPQQVQTDSAGVPLPNVNSAELLKLLSSLQNLNTQALTQSALEDASSIGTHINEAITSKTSEWAKQLSAPEANIIELVNSMFVTILEDPDLIDHVKVQIGRLQIPYIKVALLDVTLLNQATHPARLLLNELAQQGVRINSTDEPLMDLVQDITRNILDGFESDLNVFTTNLHLLRQQAKEKAQAASQSEEKTRGKAESHAKVLHVKKHIIMRMRQYLKGKFLPKEVHALLLRGFAPLLLNTYRKEGEDSEKWDETVYLLRQTVESVQPRESAYQLDAVLNHSSEILEQLQTAFAELPKKLVDNSVIEGLKNTYARLTKKLGHIETVHPEEEEVEKFDPIELDKSYQPEPDPEYANKPTPAELMTQLPEQLHSGALCEVYMGRNEDPQKLKVSSILHETAQIVFVDNSGEQSQIKDVADFLDELDCERSRIIQDEQLFDKALTAVLNNMNLMRAVS